MSTELLLSVASVLGPAKQHLAELGKAVPDRKESLQVCVQMIKTRGHNCAPCARAALLRAISHQFFKHRALPQQDSGDNILPSTLSLSYGLGPFFNFSF